MHLRDLCFTGLCRSLVAEPIGYGSGATCVSFFENILNLLAPFHLSVRFRVGGSSIVLMLFFFSYSETLCDLRKGI